MVECSVTPLYLHGRGVIQVRSTTVLEAGEVGELTGNDEGSSSVTVVVIT